ncbi:RNA polymerase II mediator complex subunit [Friedmanniomyces endolithicus]|nr:RNA polymerase II mediator complex subunit [Friedmanniomyces endolithicus]KAK1809501.1 RNA polymerase II mediator complex subunit [Friedmanniomyces endolithicus]
MADRLTQLQDAIDNQLTLMYASINYIKTRHPYGEIPGQPSQAPPPAPLPAPPHAPPSQSLTNGDGPTTEPNGPAHSAAPPAAPVQEQPLEQRDGSPPPERPDAFNAALHELARDLVLQEQQIELLINSLPGLGNSEVSQERRMRELEAELREVEVARAEAEEERERMVDALGELLAGTRRVH